MDYIYAVLLLHKTKKEITEANIKAVLTSAGVSVDDAKVKGLVATLKDINIEDAISKAAMPVAAAPVAQEAKKEEVAEEPVVSEESAAEGLSSLFG